MLLRLIYWIYRLMGWKLTGSIPAECQRCVMIAAPHTSNWDIIFALGAFYEMKIPVKFTIKKEWFSFPFKTLMKALGGIPIDRSPKKPGDPRPSMVEAMANIFAQNDKIAVMVTPEGTRKRNENWKTGFWYTAKLAGVPICLGYLNYAKKEAGVGKVIYPNNLEEDMAAIMAFYKDIPPKYQENFAIDPKYVSRK